MPGEVSIVSITYWFLLDKSDSGIILYLYSIITFPIVVQEAGDIVYKSLEDFKGATAKWNANLIYNYILVDLLNGFSNKLMF